MNTRLQDLYKDIETSNSKPFLNNQLELDEMTGRKIWGMLLITCLQEQIKEVIEEYENHLDYLEPGNLNFPIPPSQHLTINQVVHGLQNKPEENRQIWQKIENDFLPGFRKLDNKYSKINIVFSKLIATTGGIIWCAYDQNDEVEELRNNLFEDLAFPKDTIKKIHIIHTTVARYKNRLNNPKRVFDYVSSRQEKVPMIIDNISLRNELIFPSMKVEDIAKIKLR